MQRPWNWFALTLCCGALAACAHSLHSAENPPSETATAASSSMPSTSTPPAQGLQPKTQPPVAQGQVLQQPQQSQSGQAQAVWASQPAVHDGPVQALRAHDWRLVRVEWSQPQGRGGQRPAAQRDSVALQALGQRPVVLRFDEQLSVTGACNRLWGRYLTSGERMLVEPLAATKMACQDPALNALEQWLSTYLPQVQQWRIGGSGQARQLVLQLTDGGRLYLQGQPAAAQ